MVNKPNIIFTSTTWIIVGFIAAIVLITYLLVYLIKFIQYSKHLGIKLMPVAVIIQIAKINNLAKKLDDTFVPSMQNLVTVFKISGILSEDNYPYNDFVFCGKTTGAFKFIKNAKRHIIDRIPLSFVEYTNAIDLSNAATAQEILDKILKELNIAKCDVVDWGNQNLQVVKTSKEIYDKVMLTVLILNYMNAKANNKEKNAKFFKKLSLDFCVAHKIELNELENKILNNTPTKQEAIDYSWKYEQVYILCYCLGLTKNFVSPATQSSEDLDDLVQNYRVENVNLDEELAKKIYTVYYVLINNKNYAKHINYESSVERLSALNWLFDIK